MYVEINKTYFMFIIMNLISYWVLQNFNKIIQDLTPFRSRSDIDEILYAWLIVNETELSIFSILLVATVCSQGKRTF